MVCTWTPGGPWCPIDSVLYLPTFCGCRCFKVSQMALDTKGQSAQDVLVCALPRETHSWSYIKVTKLWINSNGFWAWTHELKNYFYFKAAKREMSKGFLKPACTVHNVHLRKGWQMTKPWKKNDKTLTKSMLRDTLELKQIYIYHSSSGKEVM